jgi:hypothetical protein
MRFLNWETLIKCFFTAPITAPLSQRVGAGGGSLFQDFRGEHSSRFGVIGLGGLDNFSADEWHRSFDKITFLS